MNSTEVRTRLGGALAAAALAAGVVVPGASADPHAIDAASRADETPAYQDLRSPDTRDQAEGYSPTLETQAVVDEPSEPGGFDLVSAAIGAAAAAGLSLVLMATLGLRRPTARRAASA